MWNRRDIFDDSFYVQNAQLHFKVYSFFINIYLFITITIILTKDETETYS